MRRLLFVLALALAAIPSIASGEPPRHGDHEILIHRTSGFWTSNQPAPPGYQYKWRLMAIGGVVLAITAFFVVRAIKQADDDRRNRQSPATRG
ncbi:MAG: hypothetical protein JO257_37175 [Deltaproteobacteria bacterium]|nr:hypothetical protein [Deltaproteobacteria bacterium]